MSTPPHWGDTLPDVHIPSSLLSAVGLPPDSPPRRDVTPELVVPAKAACPVSLLEPSPGAGSLSNAGVRVTPLNMSFGRHPPPSPFYKEVVPCAPWVDVTHPILWRNGLV